MSTRPHDRRAKDVFLEALELPEGERAAHVAAAAAGDEALAAAVRSLLDGHARAERWVRTQVPTGGAPGGLEVGARAGDRIGPFELVEEIGHGGFGVVWRALQHEPLRREVALKVLKAGVDTREVVLRFEAERQALALMDHPGIARVLDGGATFEGRPWFAMELVPGAPITAWCERRGLDVAARLELFVQVCRAVQHAHAKGVVHRDLKPTNVLVTEVDGRAVPKVIDFGVAKALEQPLGEGGLRTREGTFLGTPAYMSPEQMDASEDVDTRADVYALGILLYELLCGTTPFDAASNQTPGTADVFELRRRVLEEEPQRPSERLGRLATTPGNADSARLRRLVRGDLDWIVLRCLEKDRERRYDSAATLANDVERHLRGDPVLAGPPSTLYRARKLVRRHRGALAALATIVALLVVGTAVATVQALRARRAERAQAEQTAHAELELERARATAAFLENVLLSVTPESSEGMDLALLRTLLARASKNMDQLGADSPVVEASLRRILGGAYIGIADFERAERELRRALELRERELGLEHLDTLQSMHELGGFLLERRRTEEAEPLIWGAWEGRRRRLGPEHPDTRTSLSNLAGASLQLGHLDEALDQYLELEAHPTPEDPDHDLLVSNNLATVLGRLGRHEEALERFQHVLAEQRRMNGPDHPRTLATMTNVAGELEEVGRRDEGIAMLEEALERKRHVLVPEHPSRIVGANNLAQMLEAGGRVAEAEALYLDTLEELRDRAAQGDPFLLRLKGNLASLWLEDGRHEEAEALLAEVLESWSASGSDREYTALFRSALGEAQLGQGRAEEALATCERAWQELGTVASPSPRTDARVRLRLGEALLALDRDASETMAGLDEAFGADEPVLRRRAEAALERSRAR